MPDTSEPRPLESPSINGNNSAGSRFATLAIAAGCVVITLIAASDPKLMLLCIAGAMLLLLTPLAAWLIGLYAAVVMGLSGILDYHPIRVGLINVYAIDAIFAVFIWTAVHVVVRQARPSNRVLSSGPMESRIAGLMLVWCALGVVFLLYGYGIRGTPFDRAFGDIRRQCVYAAIFFVPLVFPYSDRQLRNLRFVIAFAAGMTILVGVFRLITNTPARLDENFETGHLGVRMMHIVECMTLATALSLGVMLLRYRSGIIARTAGLILIGASIVLLFLSGFRLAMAFTFAVPMLTLILDAYARREPLRRLLPAFVIIAAVSLICVAMVPLLLPEQFDKLILDLRLRLVNTGVQGGFRTWAFTAAMDGFSQSPLIGKGFGQYVLVATRNQSGLFDYVEMNNPHNMFLGVLFQTGLLGTIPFVLLHLLFTIHAIRTLRHMPHAWLPLYLSCLVGYLCYIGYSNTQPFVSSQFIIMYLLMGVVLRMARLARPPGEITPNGNIVTNWQ